MLKNLFDIFTEPAAVYPRLLAKPSVLLPLLLLITAATSIQVGYIATSDHGFLVDQLVEQALASNPTAPESLIRDNLESMNPTTLMAITGASTCIALTIIMLVTAVYLNFMGKFGFEARTYKQWLSLVCWTGMPSLLIALAAWVTMLVGNGQVSTTALQPLSVDYLLGLDSGKQILQQLSLPVFWSMGLLVLGYQHFTGCTLTRATVIILLPYVLLYGIWAYFSLR